MEHPLFIVLDNVRSAANVGNIFRAAEAARVAEIFTCGITPRVPRATRSRYMTVTGRLHDGYMPVTRRLHDCYMTVTCRLHDCYSQDATRHQIAEDRGGCRRVRPPLTRELHRTVGVAAAGARPQMAGRTTGGSCVTYPSPLPSPSACHLHRSCGAHRYMILSRGDGTRRGWNDAITRNIMERHRLAASLFGECNVM